MSLKYLDQSVIGSPLSCAWRTELNTSESPSNDGKWDTNGANGDGIGLYGGLTDSIPTALTFDTASAAVTSSKITCNTMNVDNLNGSSEVNETVTLNYTYDSTTSWSTVLVESVSEGVKFTIDVSEVVTSSGATFNVDFSWASTVSETTSTTTQQTETAGVKMSVPAGKVYQAVLSGEVQKLTIPFTCVVKVTGTTETWFNDQVNGHYNYSTSAGTAFGWINTYDCASSDSSSYSDGGNGIGLITMKGTVTMTQTVNFSTSISDVTPS